LSGREVDVAYLVGMGATNREIAARLFVSAKTVEKHLAAIFDKLAVNRRSHVAAIVSQDPALRKRAERSVALAQ
jgi:DNA-binding NarL/FixJ family response regulator